jgi:hypothetical protein
MPINSDVKMLGPILRVFDKTRVLRRNRFALSGDLGGDALSQFADSLLVHEQVLLGLSEHVNESRSNDQTLGIDSALGSDGRSRVSDESNMVADNADVGVCPGIAAAVDEFAVADEDVVSGRRGLREGGCGCEQEKQSETKFHGEVL